MLSENGPGLREAGSGGERVLLCYLSRKRKVTVAVVVGVIIPFTLRTCKFEGAKGAN